MTTRGTILLMSCYELGHQPLGIAWPKAFLARAGLEADTLDLAVEPWDDAKIRRATLVAIAVPMHTALRLGVHAARRVRRQNPHCRIVFLGLYAVLNAAYLLDGIADEVFGGEFEEALVAYARRTTYDARPAKLQFPVPSRETLPSLSRYAKLRRNGAEIPAGYVAASRGCLHHCLHCPIPPVYHGRFFIVPQHVVLEDIRRLVAAGAGHITFGDPDFLNGPGHALRLVRALHAEFPRVTYDFTAKITHLLRHRALLGEFAATGCAFIVSAVESLSDVVLRNLEKGHTRADVFEAFALARAAGLVLRPSLLPFTPWETLDSYLELLDFADSPDLLDQIDPVQLTIRLLIPPGSALLGRPAIQPFLAALEPAAFGYRWTHPDPRMDALHAEVTGLVTAATQDGEDPAATIARLHRLAARRAGRAYTAGVRLPPPERPIPARLTEPWFC
ncbi:MAG TPA: CUAEP/CCAEP-tail radical SAM protein [Gemmatimonadales bacterium]|nr:CUAEP/CCAEP-tail radical SAM protein [Gemmatimonadales bacterium]